jgi:hypothetical protein
MLDEASKIWEVVRKSVRSSQEVARKFCANCYRTRSIVKSGTQKSIINGNSEKSISFDRKTRKIDRSADKQTADFIFRDNIWTGTVFRYDKSMATK